VHNAVLSKRSDARGLFWIVIAGLVLYVLLDALAQLLPPHYSPIRDAESDLAVGPYGYIMAVNFLNRGLLSLIFLYALLRAARLAGGFSTPDSERRFWRGSVVFGVWAVGAILLAIFPTDVPATPISWHGAIHLLVAAMAFIGGALGALMLSSQFGNSELLRGAKKASTWIAILSVVLLVVGLGTLPTRIGGLTERLFLGSVLLWIGYVSAYLTKQAVR
jgi:hypothetical membrane protein